MGWEHERRTQVLLPQRASGLAGESLFTLVVARLPKWFRRLSWVLYYSKGSARTIKSAEEVPNYKNMDLGREVSFRRWKGVCAKSNIRASVELNLMGNGKAYGLALYESKAVSRWQK
jgi:hypothetical protein